MTFTAFYLSKNYRKCLTTSRDRRNQGLGNLEDLGINSVCAIFLGQLFGHPFCCPDVVREKNLGQHPHSKKSKVVRRPDNFSDTFNALYFLNFSKFSFISIYICQIAINFNYQAKK